MLKNNQIRTSDKNLPTWTLSHPHLLRGLVQINKKREADYNSSLELSHTFASKIYSYTNSFVIYTDGSNTSALEKCI